MKDLIGDVISSTITLFKLALIKLFHFSSCRFSLVERFSPDVVIKLGKGSKLTLGKRISVHSGSKIVSVAGGHLQIGDNCGFSRNCMIICRASTKIGSGTIFGPNVLVYDHDHDFRVEGGIRARKFKCGEVSVGKNCWIGANTIILRNTQIGDNCIIGAGSIVKGNIPSGTVLVQKRENELRTCDIEGE